MKKYFYPTSITTADYFSLVKILIIYFHTHLVQQIAMQQIAVYINFETNRPFNSEVEI